MTDANNLITNICIICEHAGWCFDGSSLHRHCWVHTDLGDDDALTYSFVIGSPHYEHNVALFASRAVSWMARCDVIVFPEDLQSLIQPRVGCEGKGQLVYSDPYDPCIDGARDRAEIQAAARWLDEYGVPDEPLPGTIVTRNPTTGELIYTPTNQEGET